MQPGGSSIWIGLDALDLVELRRRLRQGDLPNLARLARLGGLTRLEPDVPGLHQSVWRSFVNARPVGDHGWYFSKVWRPEYGRLECADPRWLRLEPFWQPLADAGLRLALIDVPHVVDPGPAFAGVFLSGWQTHDRHPLVVRPAPLLGELTARFGPPIMPPEHYGPQQSGQLRRLHRLALAALDQIARMAEWILRRERPDLMLMALGAPHRVGHYLWDLSQIDRSRLTREEIRTLDRALDDVYAAADRAVGRIAAAAPPGARLAAFALHGMGPNPGWNDLLPRLLDGRPDAPPARRSLRARVHGLRRSALVLKASRLVPAPLANVLRGAWSARMHDWSSTRCFALPSETGGLVRINLAGREPRGIVEPGAEYEDLCAELTARLAAVTDLETGEPIVARVNRVDQLVPADAPFRPYLPDLAVEWRERRIGDSIGVRLAGGTTLRWPRGRRTSSGRSGDHRSHGWVVGDADVPAPRDRAPSPVELAAAILDGCVQPRPRTASVCPSVGTWRQGASAY
jgi:predicted AlkP superfamily phosphohydrolase/phosphomutase